MYIPVSIGKAAALSIGKLAAAVILAAGLIGSGPAVEITGTNTGTEAENKVEETSGEIYQLRIYTTKEGKLEALHQRFRDHTFALFEKHGMENIGYWVPQDPETSGNTLIYVVSHESREAAEESWASFRADPEWQEAYEASRADGVIVDNVESIYMDAVDYSPLK